MHNKLKNKTVALVGPASSLKGQQRGQYIDSFDYIVRINYANIQSVLDSGSRTDIVYYDGSYHNYDNCNPSILVCSYPRTEWFFASRCEQNVRLFERKYDHYIVDENIYENIKKSIKGVGNTRPNSGTVAIVDLLQSDLKKLYITGLDFYRTSYLNCHPDYGDKSLNEIKKIFAKGDSGDFHDVEAQFNYFKKDIIKDERIELDEFLKKITKGEQ